MGLSILPWAVSRDICKGARVCATVSLEEGTVEMWFVEDEFETDVEVEVEVEMGEWAIVVTEGVGILVVVEGKDATNEDDKGDEAMATVGEDGKDVSAVLVSSCSCDEEWNDEVEAVRRALDVSVGSAEEMEDEEEVEEEVEEEDESMDGEGTCEGKGKASNISEEHGGVAVEGAFTLKSDGLGEDEKQEGKGKV